MSVTLEKIAERYLAEKKLSCGARKEYRSTITKWTTWGQGVDACKISRAHLGDFLHWTYSKAEADGGSNAGRTANKAREILRAILSWAWEQDYL